MPILNYGMPSNWELVPRLSKGDIFVFRQFVFNAKKIFEYKNDGEFLKTLIPNLDYDKPIIYQYDSSLSRKYDNQYIYKIQSLLTTANELMDEENDGYRDYRLDIMGTWDVGTIVIMRRRGLKKDKFSELNRKAAIKMFQNADLVPKANFMKNFGKGYKKK